MLERAVRVGVKVSLWSCALVCSFALAAAAEANDSESAAGPSDVTRRYYEAWGVVPDDAIVHMMSSNSVCWC